MKNEALKEPTTNLSPREIADLALQSGLDKRALQPVMLDIGGQCSYADYLLILSARSERQVSAIAESIVLALKNEGVRHYGIEGRRSGHWALLDFGDVVIHIFVHEMRGHYDLEGLWQEATVVPIEVPDEAKIPAHQTYQL